MADLFDIALARKLSGGGGGGGGSSDFSTAEVTLVATEGSSFSLYEGSQGVAPYGFKGFFLYNDQVIAGYAPIAEEGTPITFKLYYIGDSFVCQPDNQYTSSTGAVTYDSETGLLTITGDCTISGWMSG